MGPLEAWNQIKDCADTVKFLGGERAKAGEALRSPGIFTGQSTGGRRCWVGAVIPGSIIAPDIGDSTRGTAVHGDCQQDA